MIPTALFAYAEGRTFWLPPQASTFAPSVDGLFYFILWVSIVSFLLCMGALTYFGLKYKRRQAFEPTSNIRGDHKLEIAWSVIPGLVLIVVFAWGLKGYMAMAVAPNDTLDIRVTASSWDWYFAYPDGEGTNEELVVPVGRPVRLIMTSTDVIHSLFIPAFRVKRDVLPGRYTTLWFEATREGTYTLFCTEYCGRLHSRMNKRVRVVSQAAYEEWLGTLEVTKPEDLTYAEWGAQLFSAYTCNACHSVDGSRLVGPTVRGLYQSTREFTDGTSAVADEAYLREQILVPASKVTAGYPNAMPAYAGRLSDEELHALVEYIKELQ